MKYFKLLAKLLQPLHGTACERDRAGNRLLHMNDYMALLLLYMFNPVCQSLRSIQQVSELKKVQKKLGVRRSSLGSLSEAARVFDSDLMLAVIEELKGKLSPVHHDRRLDDLGQILTLVDGTWLKALPKMVWALWLDEKHRAAKAHTQFELITGVPVRMDVTDANSSETKVLRQNLQPGRLYVQDRGYFDYDLLQAIIDAGSSFVGRGQDNMAFEVVQEKELSDDALQAGVVRDAVVWGGCKPRRHLLKRPIRLVEVECTPHPKRGKTGRGGPAQKATMLIVTDRLDLPAEVISLIYYHRWSVEVFFRMFKHMLGCNHLLSQCQNGIQLQTYAAIIACMLIALWTGKKPTRRTYEMLYYYFCGLADEEELLAHIAKLKDPTPKADPYDDEICI